MIKTIIFLIFVLVLSACTPNSKDSFDTPISVRGPKDFGNVLIGNEAEAVVIFNNSEPEDGALELNIQPPFYLLAMQPNTCRYNLVPANTSCYYKISFRPSDAGDFLSTNRFKDQSISFSGKGIRPGVLDVLVKTYSLGSLTAGTSKSFDISLKNKGESPILYPSIRVDADVSVISTSCASTINSNNECVIRVEVTPTVKKKVYSSSLILNESEIVSFTGDVLAGEPSGDILFNFFPALDFHASSGDEVTVSTSIISDKFGNPIEDGTPVDVTLFNLKFSELPGIQRSNILTKDGIASFKIRSGDQVGQANLSAQTSGSFGSVNLTVKN